MAYITSRPNPEARWFTHSLLNQVTESTDVIAVDSNIDHGRPHEQIENRRGRRWDLLNFMLVPPKPTVWQGPHRLTKENWWAASNARNTAIALCKTEWIAFVDDRSVLLPGWLSAIEDAMKGNYAVCGPYQKRVGMTVENGFIKHGGIVTGEDNRLTYVADHWTDPRHGLKNPYNCPGNWWYGCSTALPLEWALEIGGYPEDYCDGLSGEDYIFGLVLANNNYPIKFDTRMMIVEDRDPRLIGKPMIRKDKGTSPNDKSHACLEMFKNSRETLNSFDIREVRAKVLSGQPFPLPTAPSKDWYDGEPLSEM